MSSGIMSISACSVRRTDASALYGVRPASCWHQLTSCSEHRDRPVSNGRTTVATRVHCVWGVVVIRYARSPPTRQDADYSRLRERCVTRGLRRGRTRRQKVICWENSARAKSPDGPDVPAHVSNTKVAFGVFGALWMETLARASRTICAPCSRPIARHGLPQACVFAIAALAH